MHFGPFYSVLLNIQLPPIKNGGFVWEHDYCIQLNKCIYNDKDDNGNDDDDYHDNHNSDEMV